MVVLESIVASALSGLIMGEIVKANVRKLEKTKNDEVQNSKQNNETIRMYETDSNRTHVSTSAPPLAPPVKMEPQQNSSAQCKLKRMDSTARGQSCRFYYEETDEQITVFEDKAGTLPLVALVFDDDDDTNSSESSVRNQGTMFSSLTEVSQTKQPFGITGPNEKLSFCRYSNDGKSRQLTVYEDDEGTIPLIAIAFEPSNKDKASLSLQSKQPRIFASVAA